MFYLDNGVTSLFFVGLFFFTAGEPVIAISYCSLNAHLTC